MIHPNQPQRVYQPTLWHPTPHVEMLFLYLGLACLLATVVLALHQWYIHYEKPPEDRVGNPCLQQPKDVCVFTRGTHKTPILLLLVLWFMLFFFDTDTRGAE